MSDQKVKTLSYRRANFFGETANIDKLEDYLFAAHTKRSTIELRTFADPGQPIIECRNFLKDKVGVFLHLTSHHPGEKASVLPKATGVVTGEVGTTPPPEKCEFMDGDTTALISGNNVLLCATNMHEKKAERYMVHILEAAIADKNASKFGLVKVGDINKLKLIQKQGVSSISLDVGLYEASLERMERKSVTSKLGGSFWDEFLSLFLKDSGAEEIAKAENLSARIILSYDKRVKGKPLGRVKLQDMATQMLEGEDDGFMIETLGGEKIRAGSVAVRKSVSLPKHGKSVYCHDAWRALEEYYQELKAGGLLEQ